MRNAIDFSFARPSPDDVAAHGLDILVYTGNARPDATYLQAMRARGVAVTFIQESDPNRSQKGYAAGVADAQFADSRVDAVGYPVNASVAYVVSDGSAGDPNYGWPSIAAYAKGIQDTSRRPFFFYGNQYATNAALSGAPKALGTWIPSTWGTATLLRQEANIASPIADTDLNTVLQPYGAWGQTAPTPTPSGDDDEMAKPLYIGKKSQDVGIWATDGVFKRHVTPDEWKFVTDIAKYTGQPAPVPLPLSDDWWDSLITAK